MVVYPVVATSRLQTMAIQQSYLSHCSILNVKLKETVPPWVPRSLHPNTTCQRLCQRLNLSLFPLRLRVSSESWPIGLVFSTQPTSRNNQRSNVIMSRLAHLGTGGRLSSPRTRQSANTCANIWLSMSSR